jgi:hypothetical protein
VDAGSDADATGARDVDFQPRIAGAHVDIGADEALEPAWAFTPPVVRVSPDGDDANDGSAWEKAMKTIPAAIDAATARGGEVWVAAGTYAAPEPPSALDDVGIRLPAYVYLYGGFAGTESEREQRDWRKNVTTLTNAERGHGVVTATFGHGVSTVDGFHIVVTDHHRGGIPGADVVAVGASPMIRHNTFGGGVRPTGQSSVSVYGGSPEISDCVFTDAVDGAAGVLVLGRCAPVVRRNVFRNNHAAIGVIKGLACPVAAVSDNLFDGNSGSQGIVTVEYAARVVGNTFVNNEANSAGYGPTFWGSVFANNILANNAFDAAGGARAGSRDSQQ